MLAHNYEEQLSFDWLFDADLDELNPLNKPKKKKRKKSRNVVHEGEQLSFLDTLFAELESDEFFDDLSDEQPLQMWAVQSEGVDEYSHFDQVSWNDDSVQQLQRYLLAASIKTALNTKTSRAAREEVMAWVHCHAAEYPFSFYQCCQAWSIDPYDLEEKVEYFYKLVLKKLSKRVKQ